MNRVGMMPRAALWHGAPWLVCLVLAGCSTFDLKRPIPWMANKDDDPHQPVKLVAMWHDTMLSSAGQTPKRGFGGRVMFYRSNSDKPVKVNGSLVVYGYDETHRDPTNLTPDRKFVFTAEQLEKHYSKSAIGHSYSFWLPWDTVGGERKQISLIAKFSPLEGGVVVGEQTQHLLPGSAPVDEYINPPNQRQYAGEGRDEIQPVTHEGPLPPGYPYDPNPGTEAYVPQNRMKTTTIDLTPAPGGRGPAAVVRPQLAERVRPRQPFAGMRDRLNNSMGSRGAMPSNATPATTGTIGSAPMAPPSQPTVGPAWRPLNHSPLLRSQPLGGSLSRVDRDRAPTQPHLAAPQSGLQAPLQ